MGCRDSALGQNIAVQRINQNIPVCCNRALCRHVIPGYHLHIAILGGYGVISGDRAVLGGDINPLACVDRRSRDHVLPGSQGHIASCGGDIAPGCGRNAAIFSRHRHVIASSDACIGRNVFTCGHVNVLVRCNRGTDSHVHRSVHGHIARRSCDGLRRRNVAAFRYQRHVVASSQGSIDCKILTCGHVNVLVRSNRGTNGHVCRSVHGDIARRSCDGSRGRKITAFSFQRHVFASSQSPIDCKVFTCGHVNVLVCVNCSANGHVCRSVHGDIARRGCNSSRGRKITVFSGEINVSIRCRNGFCHIHAASGCHNNVSGSSFKSGKGGLPQIGGNPADLQIAFQIIEVDSTGARFGFQLGKFSLDRLRCGTNARPGDCRKIGCADVGGRVVIGGSISDGALCFEGNGVIRALRFNAGNVQVSRSVGDGNVAIARAGLDDIEFV